MKPPQRPDGSTHLEAPYRGRAIPPGTIRYWSWLFAASESRPPLLGVYALMAEWHALMDPATSTDAAHIKLAWWRDELTRWGAGSPLHPITRHLAALPGAGGLDVAPLTRCIDAATDHVSGAPLETSRDLEPHAADLFGAPLRVAAALCGFGIDATSIDACIGPLSAAQYLSRSLTDYRRDAVVGRVSFAVEELLSAGIGNDDLVAAAAPAHLAEYLEQQRRRAISLYDCACEALAPRDRALLRHLSVLAALGAGRLKDGRSRGRADFRLADLYNAWNAARRAAAAR